MLLARLYRRAAAAKYLGMSTYTFDREARPNLTDVPIGKQGVAFDRVEMDAWVDHHIHANGRPAKEELCQSERPASFVEVNYGGSIKSSMESDYRKALELVASKKRSSC
jgi:predicted DNA-binding transcriptional regulator AlpA